MLQEGTWTPEIRPLQGYEFQMVVIPWVTVPHILSNSWVINGYSNLMHQKKSIFKIHLGMGVRNNSSFSRNTKCFGYLSFVCNIIHWLSQWLEASIHGRVRTVMTHIHDSECYAHHKTTLAGQQSLSTSSCNFPVTFIQTDHCFSTVSKKAFISFGYLGHCVSSLWNNNKHWISLIPVNYFPTVFQLHDKNRMLHFPEPVTDITYQNCLFPFLWLSPLFPWGIQKWHQTVQNSSALL